MIADDAKHGFVDGTPEDGSRECDAVEDGELLALELKISRDVPLLMETTNRSSIQINSLQLQLREAQTRHQKLLEQWSRKSAACRARYGSAIDRARPYFDATQALNEASDRVTEACREFSAAVAQYDRAILKLHTVENRLAYGAHKVFLDYDEQHKLSCATVQVLKTQEERDRCEQVHARYLCEMKEAQRQADVQRSRVGESTIRRALPCFRKLQQHKRTLASVQGEISTLTERIATAKAAYHGSMIGLERISNAIHEARKAHMRSTAGDEMDDSRQESRGADVDTDSLAEVVPDFAAVFDSDADALSDATRAGGGNVAAEHSAEVRPERVSQDSHTYARERVDQRSFRTAADGETVVQVATPDAAPASMRLAGRINWKMQQAEIASRCFSPDGPLLAGRQASCGLLRRQTAGQHESQFFRSLFGRAGKHAPVGPISANA